MPNMLCSSPAVSDFISSESSGTSSQMVCAGSGMPAEASCVIIGCTAAWMASSSRAMLTPLSESACALSASRSCAASL